MYVRRQNIPTYLLTILESYQLILLVNLTCLDPLKAIKKFLVGWWRLVIKIGSVRSKSLSSIHRTQT